MKVKTLVMIIGVVGLMMAGCQAGGNTSTNPTQKPDDFNFKFEWDTGSLPPAYHYAYQINVAADGKGEFIYQEGYEDVGAKAPTLREFSMSQAQLNQLFEMILDRDMLREKWAEGEPLLGAPSAAMAITAGGKTSQVPSTAAMQAEDRDAVTEVYDYLHSLLPQSIWDELASWRAQADAAAETPSG